MSDNMTTQHLPLVVDLDGTLIRTDLLVESFLALIKKNPLHIIAVFWWLIGGKAKLKHQIAKRVDLDASALPYNVELLAYLREQHDQGRSVVLATASPEKYARSIAEHIGLFERVLASNEERNLAGTAKAQQLRDIYGADAYVYAGNARPDLAVWRSAAAAIVVNAPASLQRQAASIVAIERIFAGPGPTLATYLRACRVHQWIKNTLVFVPLLAAHQLANSQLMLSTALAFLAFCLCASSVYILNDLLDLESDRQHRKKCKRPFAAGEIPALHGLMLIPALLCGAGMLCLALPAWFAMVLALYFGVTMAYSFKLKQLAMMDVMTLAGLYTLRLVGGSAASGIELSFWLLAFSMFIFFSLAMVKRYAELEQLQRSGRSPVAHGRGYTTSDLALLSSLGGASGYISVLVMALYINNDAIQSLYTQPQLLWASCPLFLYWISRVWLITHRGEMDDDPIVFALKDQVSRVILFLIVGVLILAAA